LILICAMRPPSFPTSIASDDDDAIVVERLSNDVVVVTSMVVEFTPSDSDRRFRQCGDGRTAFVDLAVSDKASESHARTVGGGGDWTERPANTIFGHALREDLG